MELLRKKNWLNWSILWPAAVQETRWIKGLQNWVTKGQLTVAQKGNGHGQSFFSFLSFLKGRSNKSDSSIMGHCKVWKSEVLFGGWRHSANHIWGLPKSPATLHTPVAFSYIYCYFRCVFYHERSNVIWFTVLSYLQQKIFHLLGPILPTTGILSIFHLRYHIQRNWWSNITQTAIPHHLQLIWYIGQSMETNSGLGRSWWKQPICSVHPQALTRGLQLKRTKMKREKLAFHQALQ